MTLKSLLRLFIALLLEPKIANPCSVEAISSITELNSYFESFFTTTNSTTLEEWEANLPTEQEQEEMRALVSYIYRMDSFEKVNNLTVDNYKSLKDYVNVSVVQCFRPIHHSAAHFDSEGRVCAQAAALFERTRSRSLVVAGASRYAVKGDHRSECQRQFQIADAAHNSLTMFHLMKSFNRLAMDLRMEAKTPRQDVQCKLTAGTNVFGRYVNGVPEESVCNTSAQEKVGFACHYT
ncbi:hypothetical protein ANCDUO_10006 [Ancylostoma duodenale]|uniref:Uncharacterized protein n=1 Tax=Ancylostoma duodenale TaxID=51022 RepID=A0A0C2DBE9_9BILA|nr:hypothetical protein ANCDUO_10006 [Ancylostoma duodenale]